MPLKPGRESCTGCLLKAALHTRAVMGTHLLCGPKENARPGKVLGTRCPLGTRRSRQGGWGGRFLLGPGFLFRTRCSPSCRRLAAHGSPGAEDVWGSALLPSSSSSPYWQDCAPEAASSRCDIWINIDVSQAGEPPPRGCGTAGHLSHVPAPAPGVTRSRLGFPAGSPGGRSSPSRGGRPARPRRLPRAPRAARPRRPRLCARFRGTALLTQKEAEPRRPASRRSREREVSGNGALRHPLVAFG